MAKKVNKRVSKAVIITLTILLILLITILLLPKGRIFEGEVRQVSENSIQFLYDLTYEDENGNIVYDHQIFDKVFEIIDNAEEFIIVDMFLFGTHDNEVYRNLTQELTNHLLAKRKSNPNIKIHFITDYYNVINYGDEHLRQINEAGIPVTFSSSGGKFSLGEKDFMHAFLKKFRGRLNHRKIIIADSNEKIVSLITSANPHDASSPNSNTAFYFEEEIWRDIYGLEKEDSWVEDSEIDSFLEKFEEKKEGEVFVQYLADGGLMHSLVEEIDKTIKGNSINILVFFLSDKKTINSLLSASKRGVDVKLILDTNIQSFGEEKLGIPNKPVAEKLIRKSDGKIEVRWYLNHGEQFHTKMAIIEKENNTTVFLGSSNFAINTMTIYNLQADVKVVAPINSSVSSDVDNYFNRLWNNEEGIFTTDYEKFKDESFSKKLIYEFGQILAKFI
ncbi:hypothetical protein KAR91_36460 [Candidatus Pacearchaeota archaeon]|nr:hypothetical protein [Candidatus Pacearchaeota archaeon]